MLRHPFTLLTLALAGLLYFLSIQTLVEAAPVHVESQGVDSFDARKRAVIAVGRPPPPKINLPKINLPKATPIKATPTPVKTTALPAKTTVPATSAKPSTTSSLASSAASSTVSKTTSSSTTSSATTTTSAASCPVRTGKTGKTGKAGKVAARAPQNPPQTRKLNIGGVERTINKLPANEQGLNSFVYRVTGGWPLKGSGQIVPSLAKTGRDDQDDLEAEARTLDRVGLLVQNGIALPDEKSGVNDCTFWVVMKDVSVNKSPLGDILATKSTKAECTQAVTKAVDLTVAAIKNFVDTAGILHTDSHPGNVFFDNALTEAELIDWGDAENTKTFDEAATKQLVNTFFQAEFQDVCAKKS